jgi:HK97 family phage major capsid protein
MNTFKRKTLFAAVVAGLGAVGESVRINVKAAGQTAAWFLLTPVYNYAMDPRNGIVKWDTESKEIKALETTVLEKFTELKSKIAQNQEAMDKAVSEVKKIETIEASTNDKLKELGAAVTKTQTETKAAMDAYLARVTEMEQKIAKKTTSSDQPEVKSAGRLVVESKEFKEMMELGTRTSKAIAIERKAIFNSTTLDGNQPLVMPDRRPGIIMPVQRRLTVRDLLPQIATTSDVIQFAKETLFTNNAGPQGGLTSPTVAGGEGEIKPESNLTFSLSSAPVITLAHFIAASRQVLSDAGMLQGYIDSRLGYGLKLEEELELLTADGTVGKLNGINNQAAAFSYTASGTQALDILLYAFLQISLQNMEASGVVLHPYDWVNIMKLKDTQGRYLFSNPHDAEVPQVWGKKVVPTQSQTQGTFTAGAFDMGAAIYDREGMNVRISDQHADFFTRNLVAILCEERLALAMYRTEAFVKGSITAF